MKLFLPLLNAKYEDLPTNRPTGFSVSPPPASSLPSSVLNKLSLPSSRCSSSSPRHQASQPDNCAPSFGFVVGPLASQSKIQSLSGQHSNILESLSPNVRKRCLDTKRYEIVNGGIEVEEGALKETSPNDEEDEEKGVPAFWVTAMKNNEVLAEEISERDEGALKFLKDIKWSRIENPKGFKLDFFFDTNPYFTNTVWTKTYHMINEDEPILENNWD